jgi:hypothetical protein
MCIFAIFHVIVAKKKAPKRKNAGEEDERIFKNCFFRIIDRLDKFGRTDHFEPV